jgi:hypothetical protein
MLGPKPQRVMTLVSDSVNVIDKTAKRPAGFLA